MNRASQMDRVRRFEFELRTQLRCNIDHRDRDFDEFNPAAAKEILQSVNTIADAVQKKMAA